MNTKIKLGSIILEWDGLWLPEDDIFAIELNTDYIIRAPEGVTNPDPAAVALQFAKESYPDVEVVSIAPSLVFDNEVIY